MVRRRCAAKGCNKKLTVLDACLVCKCGKPHCKLHRHCEFHDCIVLTSLGDIKLPKLESAKLHKI